MNQGSFWKGFEAWEEMELEESRRNDRRRKEVASAGGWRKCGARHALLSQYFNFFCQTTVAILWTICVYIYIHISLCTDCILQLLPNNSAVKHFYTNLSGAKCWLDIYRWGACLAVTGPIRVIRQNVLQSDFEAESSSCHSYCHMFFLIALLFGTFITNIIPCINCIKGKGKGHPITGHEDPEGE